MSIYIPTSRAKIRKLQANKVIIITHPPPMPYCNTAWDFIYKVLTLPILPPAIAPLLRSPPPLLKTFHVHRPEIGGESLADQ